MAKVPFLSFLFASIWVTFYSISSTAFYEKYSTPIVIATFILSSILVTLICREFSILDEKLEDLETRMDELEQKIEEEE